MRSSYFVSYYDYYQPEAYVPQTDTYIEKDASINDEIDRLRPARDLDPALAARCDHRRLRLVHLRARLAGGFLGADPSALEGRRRSRARGSSASSSTIQYERNDVELSRGTFRVEGDVIEVWPSHEEAIRIELFGDTVERISAVDPVTGEGEGAARRSRSSPRPTSRRRTRGSRRRSGDRRGARASGSRSSGGGEAPRGAAPRSCARRYDLEMLREMGYCNGIENYSRHLAGRPAGSRPTCLLDYFPKDF